MKKLILALTAAATLAVPMAASGQAWQSVNQRQSNLYNRIEQGVRNGSLTRPEARQLRNRFTNRYRAGGLSLRERRDLDQRFDALSRQIRVERNDRQDRRYR
jgi:Ni/Co efflux regulator RcnB